MNMGIGIKVHGVEARTALKDDYREHSRSFGGLALLKRDYRLRPVTVLRVYGNSNEGLVEEREVHND